MKSLGYFFRRFRHDSIYSIISIVGLTIGMTTTFLISLYLINELNYDRQHKNASRIYRVINENKVHHFNEFNSPYLMGPAAKEEIPGVENYCRSFELYGAQVKKGNNWLIENNVFSTDRQVFDIFSFQLKEGEIPAKFEPGDICISASFGEKYFSGASPTGKTVTMNIKGEQFVFTVKAVYADLQINSTFRPEALVSVEIGHKLVTKYLFIMGDSSSVVNYIDSWKNDFYKNFLLLEKEKDYHLISSQVDSMALRHNGGDRESSYHLQKFTDAYLHSDEIIGGNEPKGSFSNVLIFLLVSLLVLLASGMNYVLLFTSRAMTRIKELGVRRVMGAGWFSILKLLAGEAIYNSFLALPLAIMFTELLLPSENSLLETKIAIHYFQNFSYLVAIFLVPLLLGILSGLFVSIQAYRRSSAEVMRNTLVSNSGMPVKKILIVFQLVIFTALISTVLIIRGQVNMLLKSDPGYDTENLLILPFPDDAFAKNYETFKGRIASIPGVTSVSGAMVTPPSMSVLGMEFNYANIPNGKMVIEFLIVDYDFIETMGIKISSGRAFSRNFPADKESVILTESAVKEMNMKDPVGTKLPIGTVIGVIKDIQLHSLLQAKKPAYLSLNPNSSREILLRIKPGTMKEVISTLRSYMKEVTGKNEFKYNFYTDKLKDLYKTEIRLNIIILIFSTVAFFLACLGLFGLSSLLAEQRTKEVGIRKVNGATTSELMFMLSWNISRWVLLSVVISIFPVLFFLTKWLDQYVYKITISPWIFVESAIVAIVVAVITTAWHGYRCANTNPVEALKYE